MKYEYVCKTCSAVLSWKKPLTYCPVCEGLDRPNVPLKLSFIYQHPETPNPIKNHDRPDASRL